MSNSFSFSIKTLHRNNENHFLLFSVFTVQIQSYESRKLSENNVTFFSLKMKTENQNKTHFSNQTANFTTISKTMFHILTDFPSQFKISIKPFI